MPAFILLGLLLSACELWNSQPKELQEFEEEVIEDVVELSII